MPKWTVKEEQQGTRRGRRGFSWGRGRRAGAAMAGDQREAEAERSRGRLAGGDRGRPAAAVEDHGLPWLESGREQHGPTAVQ